MPLGHGFAGPRSTPIAGPRAFGEPAATDSDVSKPSGRDNVGAKCESGASRPVIAACFRRNPHTLRRLLSPSGRPRNGRLPWRRRRRPDPAPLRRWRTSAIAPDPSASGPVIDRMTEEFLHRHRVGLRRRHVSPALGDLRASGGDPVARPGARVHGVAQAVPNQSHVGDRGTPARAERPDLAIASAILVVQAVSVGRWSCGACAIAETSTEEGAGL
jgi:hypothetical protein